MIKEQIINDLRQLETNIKQKIPLFDEIKTPADASLFNQHQTRCNTNLIHWAEAGHGPLLLFIHGWTNNWQGWIPLAKILKNKYHVLLVDMPGFGDSQTYEKSYTIESQARWIADFCRTKQLHPDAVIGLSMGSFVAAQLAKDYPTLFKSVILIGPVLKTSHSPHLARAFQKTLEFASGNEFSQNLAKELVTKRLYAYLIAKYINMYRFNRFLVDSYGIIGKQKMSKEAFVQMGVSAGATDIEAVLTDVHLPLLCIWGREDKFTNPEKGKALLCNKQINFSCSVIPEAGHIVSLEKPHEVAQAITGFLSNNFS